MKRYWKYGAAGVGAIVVLGLLIFTNFQRKRRSGESSPRRSAGKSGEGRRWKTSPIPFAIREMSPPHNRRPFFRKSVGRSNVSLWTWACLVRQGQLLAMIDTTELFQQFQQASATFQNAQLNFRRTKELFDQNLVAKQDLDNADAAAKIARANFEAAGTRLSYARITAPFSGLSPGGFWTPALLLRRTTRPSSRLWTWTN